MEFEVLCIWFFFLSIMLSLFGFMNFIMALAL